MRSLKISLVCSLALFAGLFPSVTGTQSVSNSVKYLTPGCTKLGKTKEHVGLCAGDSIEMFIDGGVVFLLDKDGVDREEDKKRANTVAGKESMAVGFGGTCDMMWYLWECRLVR
jgi:hypothetical protein